MDPNKIRSYIAKTLTQPHGTKANTACITSTLEIQPGDTYCESHPTKLVEATDASDAQIPA
jgi:hypothetical protein